jgi:hypothetical protein
MIRFKPEELPEVLTPEIIDVLIEMAREFPKHTSRWAVVSELLAERGQLNVILDEVQKIEKQEELKRRATMSEEEKQEEAEKWRRIKEDNTPRFYGNMGEPETPEEYERKWGKRKDT